MAKIVKKSHMKIASDQKKLPFKNLEKTRKRLTKGKAVTRSLGRFESTHPKLATFKLHLMGIGGKKRSGTAAENIVRDVSKILYFHDSSELKWEGITDSVNLVQFMDEMDKREVGPEGQLTKLERISILLHYLKMNNPTMKNKIIETENEISQWKKTLRVGKKALQVQRLERASEMDLSLEEITAVVDNQDMWLKYIQVVDRARKDEHVPDEDLKLAMGIVMIAVKLKSYSRPSTVANCTVNEYRNATICEGSTVIKVYKHKTGKQGTAKVTVDSQLAERLGLYYRYIRPKLVDPGNPCDYLFILPGSQKVNKMSNLEKFLQKRLQVEAIPTSTRARKIGATCAARALDYQTNTLVTKQMSHQPEVSRRYYEAIHGPRDAAFAFQQMEALRKQQSASTTISPPHTPFTPLMITAPPVSLPTESTPTCRWTSRDAEFVRKRFEKNIASRQTPRLGECEDLGLDKTAKQVQDKVRTIIRQTAKEK